MLQAMGRGAGYGPRSHRLSEWCLTSGEIEGAMDQGASYQGALEGAIINYVVLIFLYKNDKIKE